GSACGLDHICRTPTGTYTLQPPIGGGTSLFSLVDADGDGVLDLAARDPGAVTLFRNDGSGRFSRWASGPMRQPPSTLTGVGLDTPHPPLAPTVFVAATTQGLE